MEKRVYQFNIHVIDSVQSQPLYFEQLRNKVQVAWSMVSSFLPNLITALMIFRDRLSHFRLSQPLVIGQVALLVSGQGTL